MSQDFDGTKIIINYMNDSIEELFRNIPALPAFMEFPSYNRGDGITQNFRIPFKFLDNVDITHKVNPEYNSRRDVIPFGGSMVSRMLDMYGVNGTRHLVKQAALIHTEYIDDVVRGRNNIVIYGISRPKPASWMSPELLLNVNAFWDSTLIRSLDSSGNYLPIMTNDPKSIESLYKHVDVFPARIHNAPREFKKKGPVEYIVYFDIDNSKDERFKGVEYNMRLNDSSINRFMHLIGITNHRGFMGKEINVYASYVDRNQKLIICGISPRE